MEMALHLRYDDDKIINREKSMQRLKGKIAMVVGAGSVGPGWGNGKATAVTFAREGAGVFCVDRNSAAAEETVEIITSEGGHATAFTADVSRAAEVEAMVAACLKIYGRIDVLDNNVGIAEMGSVVEVSEADWDRVFSVNLKSAYLAMKHVIPVMMRQGGGSIINISSIASIRHLGISYVSYGTTKAAMNQMTRTTAVEFAPQHIRVNAILPGLMKTPMVEHSAGLAASYAKGDVEAMWRARDAQVPMGHMGDAWDVANAALFLASDESKYVTGIELVVDGGVTLKAGSSVPSW
jgi:NAD(P)-dependent dehydrogenase (short-subunit alcohol dehydrogenase family)